MRARESTAKVSDVYAAAHISRRGSQINRSLVQLLVWLALMVSLIGTVQAQTVEYIHTDALGSPAVITDANRTVLERSEYEPFGRVLAPSAPTDGPGYTGHVFDSATGLNYMQQRYYDSSIGRFLSVDPVTTNSGTGTNFNRYWYANNNPYKFIDPDGRLPIGDPNVDNYPTINDTAVLLDLFVGALELLDQIGNAYGPAGSGLSKATVLPLAKLASPLAKEARAMSKAAMARGRASEAKVLAEMGLAKNTKKVTTAEGSAIPDALTPTLSVEIKDAAKVTLTRQARIETEAAKAAGQRSVLVTGPNSCVSGNCAKAYDEVIRRSDLGPSK